MHPDGGVVLSELPDGQTGTVVGVLDSSEVFLRHLNVLGVALGSHVHVRTTHGFDGSRVVDCKASVSATRSSGAAVWTAETCARIRVLPLTPQAPSHATAD